MVFKAWAVGDRHVQRTHTLGGRFQLCKGLPIFSDHSYDLCRCPCGGTRLVGDDQPPRFLHGGANCCFVHRHKATRINDFDANALFLKRFGCGKSFVHKPCKCHQCHIVTFPLDVSDPQRHSVVAIGHVALNVHEPIRFKRDNGVIVADGGFE